MDKWQKLKAEIEYLKREGVASIHPALILSYMDYIDLLANLEEKKEKASQLINDLRRAAEERI